VSLCLICQYTPHYQKTPHLQAPSSAEDMTMDEVSVDEMTSCSYTGLFQLPDTPKSVAVAAE
jgi:hypothetical protein